MKRVTVLLGSPHNGGATYTASRKFLDYLEAYGDVEGEIVPLAKYDIRTCRGCKACFQHGEERCPLKDDRDVIIEKMLDSDGVIFASPNYSWGVSGLMKGFLDRIAFVFHRPRFWGRTASSIVVQGMFRGDKIRDYLEFVAGGLGFRVVKGSVTRTLEPMTEDALRKMDAALKRQSERFHAELLREPYPTPSLFKLGMFRMGRSGVRAYAPRDQRDYAFYGEQGWFESDYYYPTHLGPVKKAFGAFFDWLGTNTSAFRVAETVPATEQSRPSGPAVQ